MKGNLTINNQKNKGKHENINITQYKKNTKVLPKENNGKIYILKRTRIKSKKV